MPRQQVQRSVTQNWNDDSDTQMDGMVASACSAINYTVTQVAGGVHGNQIFVQTTILDDETNAEYRARIQAELDACNAGVTALAAAQAQALADAQAECDALAAELASIPA